MIIRDLKKPSKNNLASRWRTFAEILDRLGDVDPARIRADIWPDQTTDEDCTESKDRFGILCEMVEGVLVEKVMGWEEARLATVLAHLISDYLDRNPLGIVIGPDGPIRIESRVIRMPDVSFLSWEHLPGGEMPAGPVMEAVPDLAVEVISRGNRPGEMGVKLQEYFRRGVRLVWYIDFKKRTARAYSGVDDFTVIPTSGTLDGGDILPDFSVKLSSLYELAFPKPPKKKGK
jgi:Uma2 family endonuclease